jgi:hypothetical protein
MFAVQRTPRVFMALFLVPALGFLLTACGSDSDDASPSSNSPPTLDAKLTVEGVATAPVTDPAATPTEVPFSATLECSADGAVTRGTGILEDQAQGACELLAAQPRVFSRLAPKAGTLCPELYGGPQRATVTGTVDGRPVDVEVTRSDGCGVAFWTALEWLLGPPER